MPKNYVAVINFISTKNKSKQKESEDTPNRTQSKIQTPYYAGHISESRKVWGLEQYPEVIAFKSQDSRDKFIVDSYNPYIGKSYYVEMSLQQIKDKLCDCYNDETGKNDPDLGYELLFSDYGFDELITSYPYVRWTHSGTRHGCESDVEPYRSYQQLVSVCGIDLIQNLDRPSI